MLLMKLADFMNGFTLSRSKLSSISGTCLLETTGLSHWFSLSLVKMSAKRFSRILSLVSYELRKSRPSPTSLSQYSPPPAAATSFVPEATTVPSGLQIQAPTCRAREEDRRADVLACSIPCSSREGV